MPNKIPFLGNIQFDYQNNQFSHSHDDYAFFAIWRDAMTFLDQIRNGLLENFEIVAETKIIWSEKHLHDNAARLYEAPLYSNIPKQKRRSGHLAKIAGNELVAFVIKDINPDYGYEQSVSKKIELSNRNVVKAKSHFRSLVKETSGKAYAVHSTNNIQEFCFQAPLLFGVELLEKILRQQIKAPQILHKDLEGAEGWGDYRELFDILNWGSNYLVLRNFESLPESNPDGDIDFLTDNFQRLASLIGMEQSATNPYKGKLKVGGEEISVDIRFTGDDYFPGNWQQTMLSRKDFNGSLFIPRTDDYFFSLLYHCKVHKYLIKPAYKSRLEKLAQDLQLDWFEIDNIENDQKMGELLAGYFTGHQLVYFPPLDNGVGKNKSSIKYLPKAKDRVPVENLKRKAKRYLIQFVPRPMIIHLQKIKKLF